MYKRQLFIICPAYFILLLTSSVAFYKSWHVPSVIVHRRTVLQKIGLWTRVFAILLLGLGPVVCLVLMFGMDPEHSLADTGLAILIEAGFKSLAFTAQLAYVIAIIRGRGKSPRGRKSVLSAWLICALLAVIRARSMLRIYYPLGPVIEKNVMFAGIVTSLFAFGVYAVSYTHLTLPTIYSV